MWHIYALKNWNRSIIWNSRQVCHELHQRPTWNWQSNGWLWCYELPEETVISPRTSSLDWNVNLEDALLFIPRASSVLNRVRKLHYYLFWPVRHTHYWCRGCGHTVGEQWIQPRLHHRPAWLAWLWSSRVCILACRSMCILLSPVH